MESRPILACVVMLAGCGGITDAPSLLPRAIEKQADAPSPTVPPVTVVPIDLALRSKIVALVAQVKTGDADFAKAERDGTRSIAAGRGAKRGSESWVQAEQARSALEAARQESAAALAAIEALLVAQTEAAHRDPSLGGIAELTDAQSGADAIVARQTARLAALSR